MLSEMIGGRKNELACEDEPPSNSSVSVNEGSGHKVGGHKLKLLKVDASSLDAIGSFDAFSSLLLTVS